MQSGDRGMVWAGWSVLLASAAIVVIVPLIMLIGTSWVEGRARLAELLTEPGFRTAVAHSFELSAAVTALAVPIGVAIALTLRDPRLPARGFWRAAVLLPLLVPDFVLGYSWLRAYARGGLTSEIFGSSGMVQGPVGVAVIVAVSAVPLVYLIITSASTRAEPITERAATSGAAAITVPVDDYRPTPSPGDHDVGRRDPRTHPRHVRATRIGTPAGFSTITTRIHSDLSYGSDPQSFRRRHHARGAAGDHHTGCAGPADVLLGVRLQQRRTSTADLDWPSGTLGSPARSSS
jgi:iron(III) transport system permease protein